MTSGECDVVRDAVPEWFWLDTGRGGAAFNMAVDEALLEAVAGLDRPVLRFYGWQEPAATFGYSQRLQDVERMTSLRPLIRRPTGGGVVPHDRDWTYTLVLPPGHEWYALRARESYRRVHLWVQGACSAVGIAVQLAPRRCKESPGQCFAGGAEQWDVVCEAQKVAGAAQRRNQQGLLIQGSVQLPPGRGERAAWETAAREEGSRQWGCRWRQWDLTPALTRRADELVAAKYGNPAFTAMR